MKSLVELGQFLKQQYPDGVASDGRKYTDIPDAEIAQKYVDKNPQYKSMVDETASLGDRVSSDISARKSVIDKNKIEADTTSLPDMASKTLQNAGQVAGGVTDVATEALKSADRTFLGGAGEKLMNAGLSAVGHTPLAQDIGAKLSAWSQQHPEAAKNLEAAINIGSLVPVGKGASLVKDAGEAAIKKTAAATGLDPIPGKIADKAASVIAKPRASSVDSVLKETPVSTFDNYANIAKKAVENNKNMTPLEYVGTRAQTALDQIQRKLDTIGSNKSKVVSSAAGRAPVGNVVVKFRQDLTNALKGKTAVEGDTKLIKDINLEAAHLGSNPSAAQVDKFIDFVQDRVYTARRDLTVPVTDSTTGMIRNLTGKLNESLKSKLPESYRTLNQQYADLVDVRNELNLKLGAQGEKGGALMKRVFSPSDAGTKELFAKIQKVTGVDLTNEATLAKYLMETVGDARQKSMLENLGLLTSKPTPSGVFMTGVNKVVDMANSSAAQLARARKLTVGGAE